MATTTHNPRYERITSLLHTLRQLSVSDLAARLSVSEVTVRKDLSVLEERGVVRRSHGGATLAQEIEPIKPVAARTAESAGAKAAIAARALELIGENEVIALDAGSTTLALAGLLAGMPVRVMTNSLPLAALVAPFEEVTLTMLGGGFRREGGSFIGPMTEAAIAGVRLDAAFVGATAFTDAGGFYTHNVTEGNTKRALLAASRRRVILADSAKFDARAFSQFAGPDLVDVLVTDSGFEQPEVLERLGIQVVIAEENRR